ncbi:Hypothetical protein A7982_03498 [Minicystis rosea]|nr:Hypothetical protein A7982_03498 [Minicystis rosea]
MEPLRSASIVPRLAGLVLGGALGLSVAPARAEPPPTQIKEPVRTLTLNPADYIDPAYDPAAHGGLSYASYLAMTRGTARRSTGMLITGILLTSLSATAMGLGTAVFATSGRCNDDGDFPVSPGGRTVGTVCSTGSGHTVGMAFLMAGTIGVAIGLPLWILGGTHVPWAESSASSERGRPASARLVPTLAPATTGHGVNLTWRF